MEWVYFLYPFDSFAVEDCKPLPCFAAQAAPVKITGVACFLIYSDFIFLFQINQLVIIQMSIML